MVDLSVWCCVDLLISKCSKFQFRKRDQRYISSVFRLYYISHSHSYCPSVQGGTSADDQRTDIETLCYSHTVGRAIDREGDEDFICNLKADFPKEWTAIIDTRRLMEEKGDSIALKDLKIEESRVLSHKLNNNE